MEAVTVVHNEIARVLDAPGMACVSLTPKIKYELAALRPGALIKVHNDDRSSRLGVPAWCRLTGHHLIDVIEVDADRTIFLIRKKEN